MFNKSVDQVMSTFRKAIDDLIKVEDAHTIAAAQKQSDIEQLQMSIDDHNFEANRAQVIRNKLSAIYN